MSKFFIDPNIARAKTIDTSFYLDPACLEKAKEQIFAPSWQYIGHTGMVSNTGDAHPFRLKIYFHAGVQRGRKFYSREQPLTRFVFVPMGPFIVYAT